MHVLCVFLSIFGLFCLSSTYENIAINKTAWQQYPLSGKPEWGADRAVDGRYTDLSAQGGQCTISEENHPTAEWRVDLGGVLSIHHIFIQYRTANLAWNRNNGYTARFLGFSVYISNSTEKDDGTLCFKDNFYTKDTIPNPTNITCITHGRYVIYYNNRTNPPYPAGYDQYAFNELCEVEVYGCPEPGYHGTNCSLLCPNNCQDDQCYAVNKTCLSCVAGYIGSQCIEECNGGTFGLGCINTCGKCAQNKHCHHINGSCMSGCDPGFYGYQCTKSCSEPGYYGEDCSLPCPHNCQEDHCDIVNGTCLGCVPGYKGPTCNEMQDDGKTSTTLYVVIVSLGVLIIIIVVLVFYVILMRKRIKKQKKQKPYEQTRRENVFTQNISGYDSVVSRAEDNYLELNVFTQNISEYDSVVSRAENNYLELVG